ncbi:hypothetical protein H4219_005125 [Mycoemilia scoparia]|uniref:Charged multivesicular body protein 7 n=1 Tax=Mycoemilia scoparia TaxID=417184 RepID=A0A9W8DKE0_9FUNG|nr:hypothetical protein H4219_005125 [Mycoemilia scoparia]
MTDSVPKTSNSTTPLQEFLSNIPQINKSNSRAALYSDLELLKTTNPDGYKQNIQVWKQLILRALKAGLLSIRQDYSHDGMNTESGELEHTLFEGFQNESSKNSAANKDDHDIILETVTCMDSSKLQLQFTVGDDTPMSIDSVISELVNSSHLSSYDQFFRSQRLVSRLTKWLIGGIPIASSILYPVEKDKVSWYVALPIVKAIGDKVMSIQKQSIKFPSTDCLMTFDQFQKKFGKVVATSVVSGSKVTQGASNIRMSEIDAMVILKYLSDQYSLVTSADPTASATGATTQTSQYQIIKFVHPEKSHVDPITKTDVDILKLVNSRNRIKLQVESLQSRIEELDTMTRESLVKKQKQVATTYLKMKKQVESDVLPTRVSALNTLEHIVSKIESSESDAEILMAYQLGTETLREFNKKFGLNADKVDDILDDLNDALADQAEVDEVLRERVTESSLGTGIHASSLSSTIIDDSELEDELEKLIKETAGAQQQEEKEQEKDIEEERKPAKVVPEKEKSVESNNAISANINKDDEELYKSFLKLKVSEKEMELERNKKEKEISENKNIHDEGTKDNTNKESSTDENGNERVAIPAQ